MKTAKNWTRIEVRPGEKGPLVVEAVKARVQTKLGRRNGPEETLVIFRERQGDETVKHDYCLSNASFDTPLARIRPGVGRGASHRRMSAAGQGRSGFGAVPGSYLEGMAPSSDTHLACHLVPDAGEAAGGKKQPRVFPCRSCDGSSDNCCMRNCNRTP